MFDITAMQPNLSERISSRLKTLGKNPSSVALQAGLGRSSVRDIIANPDANPRIDTLRKLTGPLECSLDYLTGASAEPGERQYETEDPLQHPLISSEISEVGVLEFGVFRSAKISDGGPLKKVKTPERLLVYSDPRLKGWTFELYRLDDDSLVHQHILPGDFLTVARPAKNEIIPLAAGSLVIVRRTAATQNADMVTEFTARFVDVAEEGIVLTNRSDDPRFAPILIGETPADSILEGFEQRHSNLYLTRGVMVVVAGIVVRITRSMPTLV